MMIHGKSQENSIRLGVNVDHIATLRQARGTQYPDPVKAALVAEQAGADQITVHLREDRRHIQERDVKILKEMLEIALNLEMAATDEMVAFAQEIKPAFCCLVPEKREELTTEGGLDVVSQFDNLKSVVDKIESHNIQTSFFIDADEKQIEATYETGCKIIEIHTGHFADSTTREEQKQRLEVIQKAVLFADKLGLQVHAGHGLHYRNVQAIACIPQIKEINIGHAIIAEAAMIGIGPAVEDMIALMNDVRG